MSRFVMVSRVPEHIGKGEFGITQPDFMEQVEASFLRGGAPRTQTGINQLRDIFTSIERKYGVDLQVPKIPLSRYEGLPYETRAELSRIVVQVLKTERSTVFEQVLEYNIKARPFGTKLIYFVGRANDTAPFFRHGIDAIEEREVDEYLGNKPKRQVGRPAVSNAEAAAATNQTTTA